MKTCAITGCGKRHEAKGYCSSHYERWRRHGDPEAGRTGKGEADKFLRNVVLRHSGTECLTWPYSRDLNGYPVIRRGDRNYKVTRVVCEHWNGSPPSPTHQAAHSCGEGHLGCVAPAHLRWATPSENAQDKFLHGTQICGARFGGARLTEAEARMVLASDSTSLALAEQLGVTPQCIRHIRARRTWKWLDEVPGASSSRASRG